MTNAHRGNGGGIESAVEIEVNINSVEGFQEGVSERRVGRNVGFEDRYGELGVVIR